MNLEARILFSLCCLLLLLPCAPAWCAETVTLEPAMRVETLAGYSRPETRMQVASEVAGRVVEVFADVGEAIPQDGVFASIDATFVRLDIRKLEVQRRQLLSRRDYLQLQTRRYRDLVSGRHADQSTLDTFEQDLDQAELELDALDVELERLRERLARHTVRAPAGFTVSERSVEVGEWLSVGQTLAHLGDFRTLVAPFALTPPQYQWLRQNTHSLTLRTQGLQGQGTVMLPAWLHEISPSFDPETRKLRLELAFTPQQLEARGGLRVELDVPLPDQSGAMLAPASAVSRRYEQHWLTRPDGSRKNVVLLGEEPDGRLRIQAQGLDAQQRYLLHPLEQSGKQPDAPHDTTTRTAPDGRQGS